MFSSASNASKFALINLVARLYFLKYSILDIQFINDHLKQFGTKKVSKNKYLKILKDNKLLENPIFPERLEHNVLDYFR